VTYYKDCKTVINMMQYFFFPLTDRPLDGFKVNSLFKFVILLIVF